ncbi:Ig-like domain-containing protein [Candidatus Gracilibacteria bacterium]|nr:Ig-like domain-containing protein [Candidatus Gracilibacteria bacterium]
MYTKIKYLILAFLFGGSVLASNAFVTISDSVAGVDLSVRVSGLLVEENVALKLVRPDGTNIFFEKNADTNGILETSILGFHLRQSGTYHLEVVQNTGTLEQHFSIFPGVLSAYQSHIDLENPSIVADGEAEARFTVFLKDAFGNSITGKTVSIFSSRNEDVVIAQKISDENGEIHGKVVSATPGISTLSVVIGDTVIFQKPEVVFYLPESGLSNVGADDENPSFGEYIGQSLKAQLFDDPEEGEAAYFSLENIKGEATINENLTVKVIAKDDGGNIAKNYLGTIRFSSSDDRAQLPSDYRFTPEDQGVHTFFLAISFKTPGNHTLAVHDLGDFRISGEIALGITLGQGEVEVPTNTDPSLRILTPRPGTFRTSRITITGESTGCSAVKLEDGTFVLVDGLDTDKMGNFVFQTPILADGVHILKATCSDNTALVSNEVSLKIDRTAPANIQAVVVPSGNLAQGQQFTVTVSADEPLSNASAVFIGVLTPLQAQGEKLITTLTAPNACGEYPVDVTASDLLGNEKKFPSAAIIIVCGEGAGNGGATGEPDASKIAPLVVTNVSAESGDGKVTLFWSPAKDNGPIKNYKVEFGSVPLDSSEIPIFDQSNQVPDNRTQWYVDGLSDTAKYSFRVIAIDEQGNESPASDVIQSITLGAEANMHQSAPIELEKSGSTTSLWPFVLALLAGVGVLIMARRRHI